MSSRPRAKHLAAAAVEAVVVAVASLASAFASISHFYPSKVAENYDSTAYVFIADGIIKGRIPYLQLWENKGLPLYAVNVLGRLMTPGHYQGIWFLELALIAFVFWALIRTLRRFASAGATVLPVLLLIAGIIVDSLGGNTPEFWNLGLQATGLVAGWLLVSGEWRAKRWAFWVTGFAGGLSLMTKVTLAGTWLVLLGLLLALALTRRIAFRDAARLLGRIVAGGLVAVVLSVGPILAWGATSAWLDQWIGFGVAMSAMGTDSRFTALATGLERLWFVSAALVAGLLVGAIGWLANKRRTIAAERLWLAAFLIGWLGVEIVASTANGLSFNHYSLPWLLPAIALVGVLLSGKGVRWPGLALAYAAAAVGLYFALPAFAAKLEVHRGFTPLVRIENTGQHEARDAIIREVKRRTSPSDTLLVWGMDPVVFNDTGRLSAGPYGHPVDALLAPGYQSEARFSAFVRELEAHPPKLIIDSSSMLRATPTRERDPSLRSVRPSIPSLVVTAPRDTAGGRVQPYMRSLADFVATRYRHVATTKLDVEYYELIGK